MKTKFTFFILILFVSVNLKAQLSDFITGLNRPVDLFLKANELYYLESVGNKVSKVNLDSETPTPETILLIDGADALTMKDNILYMATGKGKVVYADLSAETPVINELISSGLSSPRGLAIYGNFLFVADYYAHSLYKIDLSTETPELITVFDSGLSGPEKMLVEGDLIYLSQSGYGGKIYTFNPQDETPVLNVIIDDASNDMPQGMCKVGNNLFVALAGIDRIGKIDLSATTPQIEFFITNVNNPGAIVFYNNNFYISEYHGNKLSKYPYIPTGLSKTFVNEIVIYPNPCREKLYVKNIPAKAKYRIYNVIGKIEKSGVIIRQQIEVNELNKGLYFISINNKTFKFYKN